MPEPATPANSIAAFLQAERQRQTEFLAALVRAPSDNPPGDCAPHAALAASLLEGLGCQVEVANHGREAVQLASRQEYTLILMDCQMPEMDGYEAARLIRGRQRPGSKTRIYGTSADGEDETRERCRKAGMDGFVDKPIHVEKLRGLLQAAAGERV